MLDGRFQLVEYSGEKSQSKETTRGVIQGQSSSSHLFNLYINDLPIHIRNSTTYMYADDTNLQIMGDKKDLNEMIRLLEMDLARIYNWLRLNQIELNVDKTKVIMFGKPNITNKLE